MIVAVMTTALAGTAAADVVTLVSGSGTSGYAIPDGWTSSGTVEGGSYLKFDNGTITSPEFAPHTGLSFTYTVATFGSGTNHPLQVKILDASTEEVIYQTETATPTSSSYISTGSPLSLGDVSVPFKIQLYGSTGKGVRLRNYSITGTPAGGGSSAVATTTTIDASGITNTDVYAGTEAGSLAATVVDNEENKVEGATVTWSGDNNEVATIDATTGAVTLVSAGTVTFTATYAGVEDEYKASSATYDMTVTDSTPVPTHTATFSVNGETSTEEFAEGADIEFPQNPADVSGKTFVGWVAEAIEGTTNEAPEFVTSATMGENDVTFYAVFAYAEGGGSAEVVDVLNNAWTGVSGTTYKDWSGKTANSDAVYAGNTAGDKSSIQLRTTNSNSGIVTTTSGGKAKKVVIEWNASTADGRAVEVYGSNDAYTAATNLYGSSSYSDKLGEISRTEKEFTIDDDFAYIGIRSKSGALYLNKVEITWSTGGGVTYSGYCTTVVAAAVARPTIEVAENPFLFSTTATITCETENAAIKYSFDGENWNDYTEALTITATTTLYAKAVKDENESEVASVTITKSLAVPTVAIDATGITNTNVYEGTEAGSLAASVTYNDAAVEGATVTWSGNNDEVATIDENGAVTLVAAGTVTFTATYAGNEDYAEKTATYEMTVTNSDPNAPGTENNPYTVAQAIDATPASGTSTNVYIHGFVSAFYGDDIVSDGSNYRYYVSDDGTTDNQLLVYKGKGLNNVAFSSADDLQIGDEVVILGGLTLYKSTPEVAANNYIVSLVRVEKPAAPTFSVAEGTYTEAQSVELSTTTEGAAIYYTIDGTEPTAESTEYTSAIEVTVTTTIKAIAVKDDVASEVATATYTINTTPSIELGDNEINAFAEGTDGVIIVTYNNITEVESEVFFCDAEGNEATYDWVAASINSIGNLEYIIDANTSTEARTAYMKVYALDDNAEDVYSELITINQAGFVAPPTPGEWVETALADLTFADVFVIVGNNGSTYALSNDNGTSKAPAAVEVEVVDNTLSGEIADNIKWTLSGNATDGYTFYPYGSYESWLYCTNTNNGVRVGTNYTNNTFTFDGDYLYNTATDRYVGIYNSQDWRCYTTYTGNIADQNVKFYKKLTTSQTVTVSAAGYATLVAAHDLEIPSGVEVYAVEIRGEWAHLEPVTAGVPAGEAVVVKAEAGEYVFNNATDAVSELTVTNDLVAATAPVTVDGSQYILAKPTDQKIGFYKATGTIAAGKAYLQIASEAPVKGFTFKFDDDATAIDEIVNGKLSNGKCYNLAGQRVSKMQRGINIVNGKKILK